jgi:PAS domain S-box-containing protein
MLSAFQYLRCSRREQPAPVPPIVQKPTAALGKIRKRQPFMEPPGLSGSQHKQMVFQNQRTNPRVLRMLYAGLSTADLLLAVEQLEGSGFAVMADVVHTPEEFAAQLRAVDYDLVVAELESVWKSDLDVLFIWLQAPKMPLIITASPADEEAAVECVKRGATDFVLKSNLSRLPFAVWKAAEEGAKREAQERLKKSLAASEERLGLLLSSTAEAIYGLDREGRCTFANTACLRLLQYSQPEDLLGREMHAVCHHTRADGSPYPREECLIYQAFRKGDRVHVEDEVLWRADGTNFPAECWSYPVLRDGQVSGAVVTFLDITQRKRVERSLRESEARFRLLFSKSPLPMWLVDAQTLQFLEVNEAAISNYGYSREEFLRMRIDIRPPWDAPKVLAALDRLLAAPGSKGEWKHQLKDGRVINVDITWYPLELDGRRAVVALAQDTTERKRTAELLAEREMFFRTVIGNAPVVIFTLDRDGRFTLIEGKGLAPLGLMPGQLVGSSAFNLAEDHPSILEKIRQTLAGVPSEFVERIGDVVFQGLAIPIRDGAGAVAGMVGVALDITERKRMEDDPITAKDGAEAANRSKGGSSDEYEP